MKCERCNKVFDGAVVAGKYCTACAGELIDEARKDTARLEWCAKNITITWHSDYDINETRGAVCNTTLAAFRAAVDKAMKEDV